MFRSKPVHDWSSHACDAMRYLAVGLQEINTRQTAPQSVADNSYRIIIIMGSIFKPKMPPLPPVQPLPEPPSAEVSAEEKERIAKEQAAVERKRKGRKSTILTGPLVYKKMKKIETETLLEKIKKI